MRKPLPKSEKKVRIWSDVTPELKTKVLRLAKDHKEAGGNLSAFIRIKLEEAVDKAF
jgi:hypothetical protein